MILLSAMRKMLIPRSTTSCRWGFTHQGTTGGAMGDEMLGDEIALGNHVLHVGSPIGEGRADGVRKIHIYADATRRTPNGPFSSDARRIARACGPPVSLEAASEASSRSHRRIAGGGRHIEFSRAITKPAARCRSH
jgi:hypothetical protein